MNEKLQFNTCLCSDGCYLVQSEFARKHHAAHARLLLKLHLSGCEVVELGAGMKWQRWKKLVQQSGVLNNHGIHAGIVELMNQGHCFGHLLVGEQGVHCAIHPGPELVRVGCQRRDVGHRVACSSPGAKARSANIHCISSAVDGRQSG